MNWGRRSVVVVVVAAAVIAAVAHANSGASGLREPTPSSCALRLSGHDATVYFSSNTLEVQPLCANLIQVAAKAGELWTESSTFVARNGGDPQPADDADNQIVCKLHLDSESLLVWDSGSAIFGQQTCEAYLSSGWIEGAT